MQNFKFYHKKFTKKFQNVSEPFIINTYIFMQTRKFRSIPHPHTANFPRFNTTFPHAHPHTYIQTPYKAIIRDKNGNLDLHIYAGAYIENLRSIITGKNGRRRPEASVEKAVFCTPPVHLCINSGHKFPGKIANALGWR